MEYNNSKSTLSLSIYGVVESINKKEPGMITSQNKLNIVFITNFGYVEADEIIPPSFNPDNFKDESEISTFLFTTAVKTASKKTPELLKQCFILKNARIKTFDNQLSVLSNMILFVDEVVGLSIGDQLDN